MKRISLIVIYAKFSGRILIVKWGKAIESVPFGSGTWKRWVHNIWRLVCSLKYNWTGCGKMSLLGIVWFAGKGSILSFPRSQVPLWITHTHVALYITASLPLSAPSFPYGSAEDTHLQDIFTETFPLLCIPLAVTGTYSLICPMFPSLNPTVLHVGFIIVSGWFIKFWSCLPTAW